MMHFIPVLALLLISKVSALLCLWCECTGSITQTINSEKYQGKELTHSE